jgi:hypothetical protein
VLLLLLLFLFLVLVVVVVAAAVVLFLATRLIYACLWTPKNRQIGGVFAHV